MANDGDPGGKPGSSQNQPGKSGKKRTAAEVTQEGFRTKGISLTLDEAQECADNLTAVFKLLNKWDLERKQNKRDKHAD